MLIESIFILLFLDQLYQSFYIHQIIFMKCISSFGRSKKISKQDIYNSYFQEASEVILYPTSLGKKPISYLEEFISASPPNIHFHHTESSEKFDAKLFKEKRQAVQNNFQHPFKTLGLVQTQFSSGTGVLISKNLVLTCANILYNKLKSEKAKRIKFWAALNQKNYRCIKVSKGYFPENYLGQGNEAEYDYALLLLQQNLGQTHGFLSISFQTDKSKLDANTQISLCGYPSRVWVMGVQEKVGKKLFGSVTSKWKIDKRFIVHDMISSYGQNGGPLFIRVGNNYQVIGIQSMRKLKETEGYGLLLHKKVHENICEWIGQFGRIDLRQQRINDNTLIDMTSMDFTNLKVLNLNKNMITTVGMEHLCKSKFILLQKLYLNDNQVKIVPGEIGKFINMKLLQMSSNEINQIPESIGNLVDLEQLNLSRNSIKLLPPTIGKLRYLNKLYVDSNVLDYIPCEIGNCQKLNYISLSKNKVTSLPPEIKKLVNLKQVNIRDNKVNLPPQSLRHLKKQVIVYLSQNPLSKQAVELVKQLKLQGYKINL